VRRNEVVIDRSEKTLEKSDLINRDQLADHFKISVSSADRWRKLGCPFHTLPPGNRLVRYRISEVQAWLDQQRVQSEGAA
jgi:phage terminase Nu1 subunit (DNA packaging protein)